MFPIFITRSQRRQVAELPPHDRAAFNMCRIVSTMCVVAIVWLVSIMVNPCTPRQCVAPAAERAP